MNLTRVFLVAVVAGLVSACPSATLASDDGASDRGAALLGPFKKNLKAALQQGMMDGIPTAITVCKDEAPALAAEYSVGGVVMGRTSHRLRNPSNTAPLWVNAVVEGYLEPDSDRQPAVTRLDNGRWGYVEPIATQPVCLACHGEPLAPDVAETIAAEYPDDQATGFKVGDLRGVFWVEFPGEQTASPGSSNGG
ncbi:MAG: DUF3365 domain-containing protein [Woeseiaceae bacterium]|nr:DUF3365 domain-containing protein [Woeseiaceae bacterium]